MPGPEEKRSAEAALARMLPQLEAMAPKDVETCNVEGTVIVGVSRAYADLLTRDLPLMTRVFTAPPEELVQELVDRGLAAYGAELRLEGLYETSDTTRQDLYRESGELKAKATKILAVIAGDDGEVRRVFELNRPGTGYADRARDLSRLHPQLVRYQQVLLQKALMTEAEIDRIGELGTLLPTSGPKPKVAETARLLRNKAWTHFVVALRELNRHLDFLYYYDLEGRRSYPSLYAASSKLTATTRGATTQPQPPQG